MFSSEVLSIVIGLTFIYLLYSLLATILQEILATLLHFRAKMLLKALRRMLDDREAPRARPLLDRLLLRRSEQVGHPHTMTEAFYRHPLIRSLSENRQSHPSYLNRETFSKVMLDLLKGRTIKPGDDAAPHIQRTLDGGRLEWADLPIPENSGTLLFLRSIWIDAQADVDRFKQLMEAWFDEIMDRASEWYKKYTQFFLLGLGLLIAGIFNVDTIAIVGKLEKDPDLREQVVTQAENFIRAHPNLDQDIAGIQTPIPDSLKNRYEFLRQRRDTLIARADQIVSNDIARINDVLSIRRSEKACPKFWCWCTLRMLAGWLLTALALSLGAPFWFDLLNKLMKLRSANPAGPGSASGQPSGENIQPKIDRKG